MDSLRTLLKIGNGPSSSHTMGPANAAKIFLDENLDADEFIVELYGSLALTGKGHLTDVAIMNILGNERTVIRFLPSVVYEYHSNGMKFFSYQNKELKNEWLVFSVGGGTLKNLGEDRALSNKSYYKEKTMNEILEYCKEKKLSLYQYVLQNEGKEILDFSKKIVDIMFESVERGLNTKGTLPGRLKVKRRAYEFYEKYVEENHFDALIFACALAVSEENASGNIIVTSPTCGASGVLPGVLYAYFISNKVSKEKIIESLLVAGLVGNLVKHNASISGAEVGCQGEVGTACMMAAAALTYIKGGTNAQIEYAAEIALEHHLGMTCDPVGGYVQIPCIERNAISAKRAVDSCSYALLTNGEHYITLDNVIESMKETGKDIDFKYRETSIGGLAKHMRGS